ncbi:MAG: radical SAM family heme chaperone HemW, partial [Geobacteraceae bacterium]|nr:radical SAM family heme chaperone HemW [Geobacteraceae bacterium]
MFNRLYIHIPFCIEKCGYCAFVSARARPGEIESYHELLLREMRLAVEDHESGPPLNSIYFGGGTPSLMQPRQVSGIIDLAAELFSLSPQAEITLEANPGTIGRERLQDFRAAGVNRLSLGVQSFDDVMLRRLGRVHDSAQARHAFLEARLAGFGNIGIDLIHGLPGQTLSGWGEELRQALALSPEHISVYGLTVEEGTPFALRYPEDCTEIPDQDRSAEMFETADTVLVEAGFEHY